MIDGIKIRYDLQDFQKWKEDTGFSFVVSTYEDTGEIKGITRVDKKNGLPYTSIEHRANFETYRLTVNEITQAGKKTKYILSIEGSLHTNHFDGANYRRFTFADLLYQINYLCLNLQLKPVKCILRTFEYGFNLPVKFNPTEYLKDNLISYKGKKFDRFQTENKISIGFNCSLSEYKIKLYDKGLQNSLPYNLMRFEKAYKKMTSPKRIGIITLAELIKVKFLNELQNELLKAWDDVMLFDSSVFEGEVLPADVEIFLLKCKDPNYWNNFKNRSSRQYYKNKYKELLLKYGGNKYVQNEVKELLINEFKLCTVLPSVKNEIKISKLYGFTIKINGKNVSTEKRYCKGCGKELSENQKKGSVFCSAKFVGYERAHQCRNVVFNPSNNFRNKLIKIEAKGLLFDISDYIQHPVNKINGFSARN